MQFDMREPGDENILEKAKISCSLYISPRKHKKQAGVTWKGVARPCGWAGRQIARRPSSGPPALAPGQASACPGRGCPSMIFSLTASPPSTRKSARQVMPVPVHHHIADNGKANIAGTKYVIQQKQAQDRVHAHCFVDRIHMRTWIGSFY